MKVLLAGKALRQMVDVTEAMIKRYVYLIMRMIKKTTGYNGVTLNRCDQSKEMSIKLAYDDCGSGNFKSNIIAK